MSGDGARLITAAADNDLTAVKGFLSNKVSVDSRFVVSIVDVVVD
jgi:hypothetical protein